MRGKMKKFAAVGIVLLFTVLAVAGCKKKATPENLFGDMEKNLKDVKSTSSTLKLEASVKDDTSASIGIKVEFDIDGTMKPQAAHMAGKIGVNMNGADMNLDMEMYQVEEDGDTVAYVSAMDQWTRSKGEDGEELINSDIQKTFSDMSDAFELKKDLVKVNDQDCFELTGDLKGKDVADVINEDMLESFGMGDMLDMDALKKMEIPCTIDIYKDSILPARMYIDMKDVMAGLLKDETTEVNVESYYIELVYNEYDKIDKIEVPEEVKNKAVDGETPDFGGGTDSSGSGDKKVEKAAPSSELGKNWESYTVQINDKVLTLPCEISELEAAGLTLDTEYTPADKIVNAKEYELGYMTDAQGNEIMVDLINGGDDPIAITDCLAGGVTAYDYDIDKGGLSLVFPGGVQMGSSKEEVLAAYGETEEIYEGEYSHMYTWYAKDSYSKNCEIDFAPETGTVNMMTISAYEF